MGLAEFLATLSALFAGLLPSHAVAYFAPVSLPREPEARIIFGGDMMFDRSIRTAMAAQGGEYLFSCIGDFLADADLVVANLEGPITVNLSRSVGSGVGVPDNYIFTFPTSTAPLLFAHNIRLVSIGNNHILNFSRAGLRETKQHLSEAGIAFFGDPDALEGERVARLEVGGVPLSFVNWSDWTSDKPDHTVAQVSVEAREGRVVVVYAHWGEEYVEPLPRVRALAHQFIDAGASIVIGSHPHIVQEREVYREKDIYYSLGNFIFDQYWNDAVSHGLLLDVMFGREGVRSTREIPIELMRDRRTCLSS
ncbi:MAG: hypothetical protein RLZZ416_246 [Candidatus Parcubacteria bacterium]|jgi:poly-gamma-glutamate synthesis protein (capsule biosynthesis protein)